MGPIGSAGTAVLGIVALGEPAGGARLAFLTLLVVAVAGLKVTSGH